MVYDSYVPVLSALRSLDWVDSLKCVVPKIRVVQILVNVENVVHSSLGIVDGNDCAINAVSDQLESLVVRRCASVLNNVLSTPSDLDD